MTLDLKTLDPAIMKAGAELDTLLAEWMGWKRSSSNEDCWIEAGAPPDFIHRHFYIHYGGNKPELNADATLWSPSTNYAHAGEARRKAERSFVEWADNVVRVSIGYMVGGQVWWHSAKVCCETDGDKDAAEALATCRAIAAALIEKVKGGE